MMIRALIQSLCALLIAGLCQPVAAAEPADMLIVNRLSWGASPSSVAQAQQIGLAKWIDQQLDGPLDAPLPAAAQAQIDAMRISRDSMATLVIAQQAALRDARKITDPDKFAVAKKTFQQALKDLGREAQRRAILRYLYSPSQLREQMSWFWFNQFNVLASKRDIAAMVGDYEQQAIRPHALGTFRDLLEATVKHPAMLRYLDNDLNAANAINENYARELMELHTMGVGSGYSQRDVQELARILTGVGVSLKPAPKLPPARQALYIRDGLFEFNPARHDFGDKLFLGHVIKGSGFQEVEQALDLLAASPATAQRVSRRLAIYFVGDHPPAALVTRMTATFQSSGGDIKAVLRAMIAAPEFNASLGGAFKDPMHFVLSSVRAAFDQRVILNADPVNALINRMGEGLFACDTPNGYPLESSGWTGPGQLNDRFEIASLIAAGVRVMFAPEGSPPPTDAPPLNLKNALFTSAIEPRLRPATRTALAQAVKIKDWNMLYLSSPDFQQR